MKKTLFKLTFIIVALLGITSCSSDDDKDQTTASIEGIWQNGKAYGTVTANGMTSNLEGESEGTINLKTDGTYESVILSGYVTVNIPAMNYSETTLIEPETEEGTYSYNNVTDEIVINGEAAKVLVLTANFMKIRTLVNEDGVVGEIFTEYSR